MNRAQLDSPPLPEELLSQWRAYLDDWGAGKRRESLSVVEPFTTSVTELGDAERDLFASWLSERLFDDGGGWRGQFGGGLAYRNGGFDRPIEYALSIQPLVSGVAVPYVIAKCRNGDGGRNLRWLYQAIVGLGFRQPPQVRRELEETLFAICGPNAVPRDALRYASRDEPRARQWLAESDLGE